MEKHRQVNDVWRAQKSEDSESLTKAFWTDARTDKINIGAVPK